jgi:hypothetical protein
MVGKPGPGHRDSTPDCLADLVLALLTDPQDWPLTVGLEGDDVASLQSDRTLGVGIVDLSHSQFARTGLEVDVVSQPELMVKSLKFIGHFGPPSTSTFE